MDASKREESDQLPEEGPAEQVPDDTSREGRPAGKDSPGAADDGSSGTATGNPKAAGQDDA